MHIQRRRFLDTLLAVGASTAAPFNWAGEPRFLELSLPNVGKERLLQLRPKFDFSEKDAYLRFRESLAAHALNPWMKSWMQGSTDALPIDFVACGCDALVEMRPEGNRLVLGTVIDFTEWWSDTTEDQTNKGTLSFVDWIKDFRPTSRDDYMMAIPLYRYHQNMGRGIPTVETESDPWLDSMLRTTRGMLFWTHQWTELFRIAGNMGQTSAMQLVRDWNKRSSGIFDTCNRIRLVSTGQSLLDIIGDRSPSLSSMGEPDYMAGERLQQHFA